jgi:ABC-type phosphate transport system substrate-binding protein
MPRRLGAAGLLAIVALLLALGSATATASPGSWSIGQVNLSMEKAVEFIDSKQNTGTGAFESTDPLWKAPVAETGAALVAYGALEKSGAGAIPPAYQAHIKAAVEFLLREKKSNHWIDGPEFETYATGLALAGLSYFQSLPGVPAAITEGRAFLESIFKGRANTGCSSADNSPTANYCGGWTYDNDAGETTKRSDESNTGFALTGLQLTGGVPATIAAEDIGWQHHIQELETNPFATRDDGGGSYEPENVSVNVFSNANDTGSMLFGLGYDGVGGGSPNVRAGLRFGEDLLNEYELEQPTDSGIYHDGATEDGTCTIGAVGCDWHLTGEFEGGFHYSMCSLSKGFGQFSGAQLQDPSNWYAKIVDLLLNQQESGGGWPADGRDDDKSPLLATSFSVCALGTIDEKTFTTATSNREPLAPGVVEPVTSSGELQFSGSGFQVTCKVNDKDNISDPEGGAGIDEMTTFEISECTGREPGSCPPGSLRLQSRRLPWSSTIMGTSTVTDQIEGIEIEAECEGRVIGTYSGTLNPTFTNDKLEFKKATLTGAGNHGSMSVNGIDKLMGPEKDEEISTTPSGLPWTSNGAPISKGGYETVTTRFTLGGMSLNASGLPQVSCGYASDQEKIINPLQSIVGTGQTTAFTLRNCKSAAPICTSAQLLEVGPRGLPWNIALQPGQPVRAEISGVELALECKNRKTSSKEVIELFKGSVSPKLGSSALEFTNSSGTLTGPSRSATIVGVDSLIGGLKDQHIGAGGSGPLEAGPERCAGENIVGAGSVLQRLPQQAIWDPAFNSSPNAEACSGIQGARGTPTVAYTSTGSGAALETWGVNGHAFEGGRFAFLATEKPVDATERLEIEANASGGASETVLTLPVMQFAVAIPMQLPENCHANSTAAPKRLVLDNKTLELIFRGVIKKWSEITEAGDKLEGAGCNAMTPIVPVVRSANAGETFVLKRYLGQVNPAPFETEAGEVKTWEQTAEGSLNTAWPKALAPLRATSGAALLQTVAETPGSIGYATLFDARASGSFTPPSSGPGTARFWPELQNNGTTVSFPAFSDPSTNGDAAVPTNSNCAKEKYVNWGRLTPPASSSELWNEVTTETKQTNYTLCGLSYDMAFSRYSLYPGTSQPEQRTVHDFLTWLLTGTLGGGQALLLGPSDFAPAAPVPVVEARYGAKNIRY